MTKTKQPKKGTISATVTALVANRKLTDETIVSTLRKKFRHLTEGQARAHVRGARRATGHKAPNAVKTPNVAKVA